MTIEEKRRLLSQYRQADRRIARLLAEKATWMERATAVTPVYRAVPPSSRAGGGSGGRIPAAVEKIDAIEREIEAEIDALADMRRVIAGGIQQMESGRLKDVLCCRVLSGMTWEQTAQALHLDERWVRRLYPRALAALTLEGPPHPVV